MSSRTFRIFVSSTFTDFVGERSFLHDVIWPKLRITAESLGGRFVPIDLRWGIARNAQLAHATVDICLAELQRSREISPEAYCLVLLGQRYGWRPPPPRISIATMDELRDNADDPELLTACYRVDANAHPWHWRLLPAHLWRHRRRGLISERVLIQALYATAARAGIDGDPIFTSITEAEVNAALATGSTGVFAYQRVIQDLHTLAEPWLYSDEHAPELAVPDGPLRQRGLIETVMARVPDLRRFEAHRSLTDEWHDYLELFGQAVLDDLTSTMHTIASGWNKQDLVDLENLQAHQRFGRARRAWTIGREAVLTNLTQVPDAAAQAPKVVIAPSGTGKSAVLAAVAASLSQSCAVVARYIGATPSSRDLRALLADLSDAIPMALGEIPVTSHSDDPLKTLSQLLELAQPDRPLVLILDGLDQLNASNNAFAFEWLPKEVPAHCTIILSSATGVTDDRLMDAHPEVQRIPLDPLERSMASQIMTTLLASSNRSITKAQHDSMLAACLPSGLWFMLACERLKSVTSYDPVPQLSSTIDGLINAVVSQWQQSHGSQLVRTVLAALAVSRNGLTEDQIESLIGSEPRVRQEFAAGSQQVWSPSETHLPSVVWARLRADLDPYLAVQETFGLQTLRIFHQSVVGIVKERFVNPVDDADIAIHERLARLFAEEANQASSLDVRASLEREVDWHRQQIARVPQSITPGIGRDTKTSILYHLADAGDGSAMFWLAARSRDTERQRYWYRASAEVGFTSGMVNYGQLIEEQDPTTAEAWYERAVRLGDSDAAINLARLRGESTGVGHESIDANQRLLDQAASFVAAGQILRARRIWLRAADQGSSEALVLLGDLCHAQNDVKQSRDHWERAADLGNVSAMERLGAQAIGRGDAVSAQKYWEMAASRDSVSAMLELAELAVISGDRTVARSWLERAADRGDLGASRQLRLLD